MITVIVPTMWKANEINVMLPLLNDHPLVGEIILIDNDSAHKNQVTCSLSKVKYVSFGRNIFPVPSWNYGWENASYDKLLIINDDVLFDLAIVDLMDEAISENIGTIMINSSDVHNRTPNMQVPSGAENVHIMDSARLEYKAAVIIGIHKKVYEKIPEDLLIYHNDSFLFYLCEKNGKPNKIVCGAMVKTEMSTTVKHFPEITRREWGIYKEVFKRYGIETP